MTDIFQDTTRPKRDLFFKKNDKNDVRLGEIVSSEIKQYTDAEIIILGCPQDEGVRRNGGRIGAALAPDSIRTQFYKLTNFGIKAKIFDIGNTSIKETLEETHETHTKIVRQILKDGKKIIVLGGGNDISYADGRAMAEIFGSDKWIAFNIDAHLDVRDDFPRNSGTPYRQLLEENYLMPEKFYELGFQEQVNSPVYFQYLKDLKVNLTSLSEYKLSQGIVLKNAENCSNYVFWGFDVDSVRMSDAPGVSAPNPIGFTADEFCDLARYAGVVSNTRIIEFTEVNPNFDIDNQTAKLVSVAMHRFCAAGK